jgi:glycosyltransferase involved in cell wall biosynthesis
MSIDILIPTYNRQKDLIKNIRHLNRLITKDQLESYFRILVSDNCSGDDTWRELENVHPQIQVEMHLFKQNENTGLEKNAVFLLRQATSEFVMYIGDDDYLPENYLKYIIETINKDNEVSAIVPGIEAFFADGTTKIGRRERFDFKRYPGGLWTAMHVAYLGHQLSGILLKRVHLESNYLKIENYRNIYPFIYFLSYNALRGSVYYAPVFKVLVTASNSKDWGYDDSGLLAEIFKNFNILYPHSPFKRFLLCYSVLKKQGGWRLRVGKRPWLAAKAVLHIWTERQTDLLTKIGVLFFVPYLYTRKVASACKRSLWTQKNI